jgi:hypothetical protein
MQRRLRPRLHEATDIALPAGIKVDIILSARSPDNGGSVNATGKANATHALGSGSPAGDAAPCVLPTDQRGLLRH